MRRTTFIAVVLLALCCQVAVAQSSLENIMSDYSIAGCRYWFDNSTEVTQGDYSSGQVTLNVSALEEGFHTLHYQILDSRGEVSPARTAPFFRLSPTDEQFKDYTIQKVRYWFDKDYTPREVAYVSGTSVIDVSALEEGFHTLHYQVLDSKGEVSPSRTSPFFRVSPVDETFKDYEIQGIRYWFDKDYTPKESSYVSGTSTIDVSALDEGFHTLHYQVVDSKGEVSPSRTSPFFRVSPVDETFKNYKVTSVRYWLDNDETTARIENYNEKTGVIDLSYLGEGAHTLHYQVVTYDGQVSPTSSTDIYRRIYDIYISKTEEYDENHIAGNSMFAEKPDLKLHFLPDDVNVRGHLTVDDGASLSLSKFVQTTNLGSQTSNRFTKAGIDYYHPTTLVNNGFVRADSVLVKMMLYRDRWHFVSLPFNVNVKEIGVPNDTYWALRRYDGEARAAGMMTETWDNLSVDDMMETGKGYIIQFTKEGQDKSSWFTFKANNDTHKNDVFTKEDVSISLEEHQAEFAHNRSWNLVGNPYPSFFDSRFIGHDGIIIVWNGNGYSAYSLMDDEYVLMPFEAFFVQRPVNVETLDFNKEGRQDTHEARVISEARENVGNNGKASRRILNFMLSDDTDTDMSRVVVNEHAAMSYESDKDAPKFMEKRPLSPQLFSVEGGVQYAINERPMGDGVVTFSFYAPTAGNYRFCVDGNTENVVLTDMETGDTWSLTDGDYEFEASEGIHNGRIVVSLTGDATAISEVNVLNDGEIRAIDGTLSFSFTKAKSIKVFSMDGKMLYSDVTSTGNIKLAQGIYAVLIDGVTTKIMIK